MQKTVLVFWSCLMELFQLIRRLKNLLILSSLIFEPLWKTAIFSKCGFFSWYLALRMATISEFQFRLVSKCFMFSKAIFFWLQEDILSEIRTVEAEASAYFDQMSRYFLSRAKIVTKIAKYPHVVSIPEFEVEQNNKSFLFAGWFSSNNRRIWWKTVSHFAFGSSWTEESLCQHPRHCYQEHWKNQNTPPLQLSVHVLTFECSFHYQSGKLMNRSTDF